MALLEALRQDASWLLLTCTLLGLVVGSFLNVVILRLPRMLEQSWRAEARQILELPAATDEPLVSLASPPSSCPGCGARIRPWHNIPLAGWLMLRGRCASCGMPISIQYPVIEAISGLAAAICALHFGWSAQLLPAMVMSWTLIALTVIDLRTMLLPDNLTLPLMWLGLLLSLFPVFASLHDSVVGAMAGYLSLRSMYHLFLLLTGKEGMGFGDFKLFAAFGAWLGWQALPGIIIMSSVVGAVVGIGLIVFKRHGREVPIPFGPYLAGAGWIYMVWGAQLRQAYFAASGIH
ncbi:MAG TPA: A24 family peptidase [Nevskiaceae bacterium]|nr:A24 family peptidase [Nevskiaceae bacterium]